MTQRPAIRLRVNIENLEDRLVLSSSSSVSLFDSPPSSQPTSVSAVNSELKQGTLSITGTADGDLIRLRCKGDRVAVAGKSYSASKVKRIIIAAEEGSDVVLVDSRFNKSCRIFAGAGNDQVVGGRGNDVIYGDSGNDTLQGGGGNDVIYGGANTNVLDGGSGQNSLVEDVPVQRQSPPSMATDILQLVNAERVRQGLKPLTFDARLNEAADIQAQNMARQSDLSNPDDALRYTLPGVDQPALANRLSVAGFAPRYASENIAFGYATAAEVVAAWLASPGHRANILSSSVTLTGIATHTDSQGVLFYCQVFGQSL